MLKMLLVAIVAFAASTATASADDVEAGAKVFKKCAPCHDVGETAKNKVGPILNGLDGRQAGTVPDYAYSDANKNSGITWNKETFVKYIKDPKAAIPKTKMVFIGIKKESEAEDLWAYLKQFGPDGKKK